jgi:hypothetical protein
MPCAFVSDAGTVEPVVPDRSIVVTVVVVDDLLFEAMSPTAPPAIAPAITAATVVIRIMFDLS